MSRNVRQGQVHEIRVGFLLDLLEDNALPHLVAGASSRERTPRAEAITFLVVLFLFGAIPKTKDLSGQEGLPLLIKKSSGGFLVDELVAMVCRLAMAVMLVVRKAAWLTLAIVSKNALRC